MIIASDIHDSTDNELLHKALRSAIEKDRHRTLIVAGDLTCKAGEKEYRRTELWVGDLIDSDINVILASGNHDMSKSYLIIRRPKKSGYDRFDRLMERIEEQNCVVARMDEFDTIYRVGNDVFYSARSTHAKFYKGNRIAKDQFALGIENLKQHLFSADNGFRLHLITHQSLWKLKGDVHSHINKRKRLVKNLLRPFGFQTAINGHNHRFDQGIRKVKKDIDFSIYHIQAPTLSNRIKGKFEPGFVSWDPEIPGSAELIPVDMSSKK